MRLTRFIVALVFALAACKSTPTPQVVNPPPGPAEVTPTPATPTEPTTPQPQAQTQEQQTTSGGKAADQARSTAKRTIEELMPTLGFSTTDWSAVQDLDAVGAGGERYALLMGVGTYLHAPRVPNLPWAGNDLDLMKRSLVEHCGFSDNPDTLEVLRDADVTPGRLRQALQGMARRMRGEGNLLVVYFTGHGLVDTAGERVFLRRDADPDDPTSSESAIQESFLKESLDEVRTLADANHASVHRVVILDCCYVEDQGSNAGLRPKKGAFAGALAAPRPMAEAILSACQPAQSSQDYRGQASLWLLLGILLLILLFFWWRHRRRSDRFRDQAAASAVRARTSPTSAGSTPDSPESPGPGPALGRWWCTSGWR